MAADTPSGGVARVRRADARRNVDALLEAARTVFRTSGVDAPAKEITDRAGVGVGTLYRHFPQRSDLVLAVLQRGIDECADAAPELRAAYDPGTALAVWLDRYTAFVATKQGLASALHSAASAHQTLYKHFVRRLEPAVSDLLHDGQVADEIRRDVSGIDLLHAVALLCVPVPDGGPDYSRRMVAVLMDGLRRRAPEGDPDRH